MTNERPFSASLGSEHWSKSQLSLLSIQFRSRSAIRTTSQHGGLLQTICRSQWNHWIADSGETVETRLSSTVHAICHPRIFRYRLESLGTRLHYHKQDLASATQQSYKTGQKRYVNFCTAIKKLCVPTTKEILSLFISYLGDQDLSVSTIKVYLSAVRNMHVHAGLHKEFANQLSPRLELILKGIKCQKAVTTPTVTRPPSPVKSCLR